MKTPIVPILLLSSLLAVLGVLHYVTASRIQPARHALLALESKVSSLYESQAKSEDKLNTLVAAVARCRSVLSAIERYLQVTRTETAFPTIADTPLPSGEPVTNGDPLELTAEAPVGSARIPFTLLSQKTLKDVLEDPDINPLRKVPDKVTKARIDLELTRAQSRLSVLRSEITVELIQGMDVLRDAGQFIEYPGDGSPPPPNDPSVLSVAEQLPSGLCRMYWLDREQFPAIHSMRRERRTVAAHAVNAIAALIADSESP